MQAKKLYKHYTLGSLPDTLDVIDALNIRARGFMSESY